MISWLRNRLSNMARNGSGRAQPAASPAHAYSPFNEILPRSSTANKHRLLIGTPCTGLVRAEWAFARFGAIIPCNWSHGSFLYHTPAVAPLSYTVADAQNVCCKKLLEIDAKWLFLHEEDNVLPPDTFLIFNEYMLAEDVPVVSGLYFTKSLPAEPMTYRGRGTSYYDAWKIGDKVWCDGVPTGCLLVHNSIIRALWEESEEYLAGGNTLTRRIFTAPESAWCDPEKGWQAHGGTSDLEWCSRMIVKDIFRKADWSEFAGKQYPFVVDTRILTPHIRQDGIMFPSERDLAYWRKSPEERREERRRERDEQRK